jgi:hypothetical protein
VKNDAKLGNVEPHVKVANTKAKEVTPSTKIKVIVPQAKTGTEESLIKVNPEEEKRRKEVCEYICIICLFVVVSIYLYTYQIFFCFTSIPYMYV